MFYNYLKQAWRNLVKNRSTSVLNIAGLTTGLTCFAYIALWVNDELSYDKFNKNYDRIFRVTGTAKTETGTTESAVSSAPMAQALRNDYAEVENAVRLDPRSELIEHNGQKTLQSNILITDPSLFDIFSYQLSRGDQATALREPYSVILTESTAKKYFGNSDPIGKSLKIYMNDSTGLGALYKVTGVMPDPSEKSHFNFTMLASFKTIEVANPDILTVDGWGDASYYTYLLLKDGVDHKAFSNKMSHFYGKYIGDMFKVWRSIYSYKLQPLRDIYLRSQLQYEIAPTGNINHIYIFSTIGIFILLLAGINYVNLATARSMSRAKEISVKKVVGALKNQLILQFLLEAIVTALIALVASLVLCIVLQPIFFQVAGKDLSPFCSPLLLAFLFIVTILLGILSGLYPAMIISRFKPAIVLKGSFKTGAAGVSLRKLLVIAQFAITLILVTGIIIIHSQMSYIKHKDLGYDRNALLFLRVNGDSDIIEGYDAFKNELISNVLISGITTSNSMIFGGLGTGGSETVDNSDNPMQVNTARLRIDPEYFGVYGIKLIAGRNFSKNPHPADTMRLVIVNEVAVKKFGWKNAEAAIGKPFRMGNQQGSVIGVVKDFHFNSLQQAIEPLAMYLLDDRFSRITLKVDLTKANQSITWIEKTWKKHFPSALLDYSFLDSQIEDQYQAEKRFSKIFLCFSVLSLLIACFGLYGLISYAATQKTKEIGIRKVLGATVNGIVLMLSTDLLKLVALAFLVATPVSWFIMNNWLQDFAYRTSISWWMFAVSGLSVLVIAFITISFRAIKAAIANPVKSLRTE